MALTRARLCRPIALSIEADGTNTEPPTAFPLFKLGQVETTKGTFLLTKEDAAACVVRQIDYGNDLSIDYGHGVLKEDEGGGGEQAAAGWIGGLEARDDALWAINVTWTPKADAMIRAREQRFHSPLFLIDEGGHITEILNVALTLMPATYDLVPLVASRHGSPPTRSPSAPSRGASTKATSIMKIPGSKAELTALADQAEKDAGDDEAKKEFAAKLRKLADDAVDDDDKKPEDKPTPASDDDKDPERVEANRIAAIVRQATGLKSASAIEGALRAMGDDQKKTVQLSGQIAQLTEQVQKLTDGERRARITNLVKASAVPGPDCKVTPAEVDHLVSWGMKDEEALTSYLKTKAPIVAASAAHTPGQAGGGAAGVVSAAAKLGLTPEEEKFCKLSNLDPKLYAASKLQSA